MAAKSNIYSFSSVLDLLASIINWLEIATSSKKIIAKILFCLPIRIWLISIISHPWHRLLFYCASLKLHWFWLVHCVVYIMLWLVGVITLVLMWRQTLENHFIHCNKMKYVFVNTLKVSQVNFNLLFCFLDRNVIQCQIKVSFFKLYCLCKA